jgi:hypothetical protein
VIVIIISLVKIFRIGVFVTGFVSIFLIMFLIVVLLKIIVIVVFPFISLHLIIVVIRVLNMGYTVGRHREERR